MEGQPPSIGNPLTYRDGMTMTWQGGRELTGLSKGGVTTAYQYNENSIRTKKTVGASTTEYYLNGNAMIAEKKGNNLITYMFDENGERYGFLYNSTPYYYVRNIQGDVIRILNSAGSVVAKYEYNAWGKVLKVTNASGTVQTSSTFIGNVNPIRYRGYYYDSETGFYYLQSRYYDPETGRFINADEPEMVVLIIGTLLNKNLYTYCGNGPINSIDPNGYLQFSTSKNYYTLALNEWETTMLLDAIALSITAASAVTAVLAAIPTFGVSFAVAGAIVGVGSFVVATLRYIDRCGGNKGLNFNLSRKWYLINYVGYNKKEPAGFKNLSQLWSAVKAYANKILNKVKLSVFEKLAKNKSKITICRLARVIVDYKKGKKIVISKY